jgi:outer membrane protein TolC
MRTTSQPLPVSLEQLIASAVCYSDQLRVYSDAPLIRDMIVVDEDAKFDWVGFTEAMWNDISEPVGSTLTTGGPSRLQDEKMESRFGLRRRGTRGGRFEMTQEFGHQNNNSVFFQPDNQGTSQLTLSYTQPLLRGAGRVYNSSLIVLAQIDSGVARDEFSTQLQTYLLDVTNAYWSLFQQRAVLLQKERLFTRGQEILDNLEHRSEIDALASQIVRARAAVAIRHAELYRAATQVKNAESRIRALVNAPQLGLVDQFELLPVDAPGTQYIPVGMAEAMTLAIKNRPELHQSIKRIKAASIRKNMSANELLPVLDIVLETYVRGLRGNSQVMESFVDSFSKGAPSYTAGIQMELPLGNRAARASMRRREIELRQLESQFRATVDVLQLEVEVVVREVHTAFQEISAKYQSVKAAEGEVDYLTQRWKLLSGEDRSASLVLEDLLSAQDRLAAEEFGFLAAQIAYNQSFTDLKQVTGSLLQLEEIDVDITPGPDGNPMLRPIKRTSYPMQQVSGHQVPSDEKASRIPTDAASRFGP